MTEVEKSGSKVVFMAGNRVMELGQFTRFSPGTYLVVYVDLLGFKEMILKAPGGKDLVPLLEESLSAGLSFAKLMRDTTEQLRYRMFSDNICAPLMRGHCHSVQCWQLSLSFNCAYHGGGSSVEEALRSASIM